MNRIATALAAVSFAFAATLAQAQTPSPGKPDRGQMREGMKAAYEACKDKPDRRACMMESMCAKASDPAKCQARAKERGQHAQKRIEDRQKMHEACNGKRGEDLSNCMKGQRQQKHAQRLEQRQKAHEACSGKRGDELGKCLREQLPRSGHGRHHRMKG